MFAIRLLTLQRKFYELRNQLGYFRRRGWFPLGIEEKQAVTMQRLCGEIEETLHRCRQLVR